jgi:uncharacterized protein YraI
VVDFEAGTVNPIQHFVEKVGAKAGGPVPVRVDVGQFALVATDGGCLNVRAEPSTSAAVIACYVEGVLLGVRTEVAAPAGWTAVKTPLGEAGWAASEYLELP